MNVRHAGPGACRVVGRRAVLAAMAGIAVSGCSGSAQGRSAVPTYRPPRGGVTIPLPGAAAGQTLDTWRRDVDLVAARGIRLVRAPASSWIGFDPGGSSRLTFATAVSDDTMKALEHARQKGVSVLVATPGHPGGPSKLKGAAYTASVHDYLSAMGRRMNGYVDAWQVFNEPDRGHFRLYSGISPDNAYRAELADALRTARAAITTEAPGVPVLTNLGGYPCNDATETGWRATLEHVAPCIDVVGLDCYCGSDEGLVRQLPARVERIQHAYNKPVWVVETGFPTGPQDSDGSLQERFGHEHLVALRRSVAESICWYTLRDPSGASSETGYGLMNSNWQPKRGFATLIKDLA